MPAPLSLTAGTVMPTPGSADRRPRVPQGFALCTVVYAVVLVCATHYPRPEELLGPNAPSDKTLHFIAYAALATLAGATLVVAGRWTAWTAGWLGVAMAAFGVVDELTQPLFGRTAEPLDWIYDCIGVSGGLLVVAAIAFTITRRDRRHPRKEAPSASAG